MSVQKWLIGALARQKRQLGNPSGRPKGARNLLSESVLKELTSHWGENGLDAIDRTCKEQPAAYLRAVLSLVPNVLVNLNRTLSFEIFQTLRVTYRHCSNEAFPGCNTAYKPSHLAAYAHV